MLCSTTKKRSGVAGIGIKSIKVYDLKKKNHSYNFLIIFSSTDVMISSCGMYKRGCDSRKFSTEVFTVI